MSNTTGKTTFARKLLKQMSLSINTGVSQKKKNIFANPNQTGAEGATEEWQNQDDFVSETYEPEVCCSDVFDQENSCLPSCDKKVKNPVFGFSQQFSKYTPNGFNAEQSSFQADPTTIGKKWDPLSSSMLITAQPTTNPVKLLGMEQQNNCAAQLNKVANQNACDPEKLLRQLQMQQGLGLPTTPKRREKKVMSFASRKQMLKYIENFRVNYKTQMCRNFMTTGVCEFGDQCCYAHGHAELNGKPSGSNKNYKTKYCKQWHETTPGRCTYGNKCQFIHQEIDPFCMPQKQIKEPVSSKMTNPAPINQVEFVSHELSPDAIIQESMARKETEHANDSMKSPIQEEVTHPVQEMDKAAMTQLDTLLSSKKYLAVTIPVDVDCQGDEDALDEMLNYQFINGSHCSHCVEFDEFKNIEKNIKREILDYSSAEESPTLLMNDSKSDEDNVACSVETLSSEGDINAPTHLPSGYNALINEKGYDAAAETQDEPAWRDQKSIGHKLMDRKRLRVFQKIYKPAKSEQLAVPLAEDKKAGGFFSLIMRPCKLE